MINSEQQRLAYLQAIGIDVWLPRDAGLSDDAEASEDAAPLDWNELRDCVSGCTRCELSQSRTQTVFGVGDPNADWLIIGEAPGAEEDRRGEPFVGRAGQLLDQMLLAIGQRRETVFITNILKCRPPHNRDPKPAEAAACRAYLDRQIELIQPKIILAVGKIAAQNLLDCNETIGRMRERQYKQQLERPYELHGIPLVVTYHPAYLLRSPSQKRKSWNDLCLARRLAEEISA